MANKTIINDPQGGKCKCTQTPNLLAVKQSLKDPSRPRTFLSCRHYKNENEPGCRYFKWADHLQYLFDPNAPSPSDPEVSKPSKQTTSPSIIGVKRQATEETHSAQDNTEMIELLKTLVRTQTSLLDTMKLLAENVTIALKQQDEMQN